MPAKHHPQSPSQSHPPEPPGSPKQDPTERRRLQNRLSQRNHRRKIRDRIAKLQERVIASELRAAATLHGWHSAPCIPYEVRPSPSSNSSSLSLSVPHPSPASASASSSSSSSTPPNDVQCPPASAYALNTLNLNLGTIPPLSSMISAAGYDETGTVSLGGSGNGSGNGSGQSSGTASPRGLVPSDPLSTSALLGPGSGSGSGLNTGIAQSFGLDTMAICEQWGFQGSVYLATGDDR
ncbi:hypothetical protein BJX70DRAFT_401811 [Aspergillus crustosus]